MKITIAVLALAVIAIWAPLIFLEHGSKGAAACAAVFAAVILLRIAWRAR